MYVDLSLAFGWSPQTIADMTPAQQYEYLEELGKRQNSEGTSPNGTLRFQDMRQYNAWAASQGKPPCPTG